jgi:hypothetical protein
LRRDGGSTVAKRHAAVRDPVADRSARIGLSSRVFHEAWYRIADLRPRLLSGVNIRRQYFRGQLWYVLENPANSEYARIAENAYRFAGKA